MNPNPIVVLDFGGQYAHLIANRIRRLKVYSEIKSPDASVEELRSAKGIILSGGPASVHDPDQPPYNPRLFELGIPVLGLCYGHQLMCRHLGGTVTRGALREYGAARLHILSHRDLFRGLGPEEDVWMSHGDSVEALPEGFERLGYTEDCPAAAVGDPSRKLYGLQFHPEVTHTPHGMRMLQNFVDLCACDQSWTVAGYVDSVLDQIKRAAGDKKVFLLVSGGVDSTVAFALLVRALGAERVHGLHVDNGLMRKDESRLVACALADAGFSNLALLDASQSFLDALAGVVDPEEKRRIIGEQFVQVAAAHAEQLDLNPSAWMLAQGTIYPDTIETGGSDHAARIKTHHNRVQGVQELIQAGKVIEPLAQLYKDEVREVGLRLGLPEPLVWRHPFPGPGLGVRVLCTDGKDRLGVPEQTQRHIRRMAVSYGLEALVLPVRTVGVQGDARTYAHPVMLSGESEWDALEALSTSITNRFREVNRVVYLVAPKQLPTLRLRPGWVTRDRLDLLREADAVATRTLDEYDVDRQIWQMPVILVPLSTDGTGELVALRPVRSTEAMTARFARIPAAVVRRIAEGILALGGIQGVLFDTTHKPPATIEWE